MQAPEPDTRHLTFLFADVEGSTRVAEAHPAEAGTALARYHEIVAGTAERHGGWMFERIGDGAYACFESARTAVAAADELQGAIAAEDWGVIGRLRIRIGLLTGDVEARGDRYYGRPLFRTARLMALAKGGETLAAGGTIDELGGWLPDGVMVRDLGSLRLRDVPEPERVFALVHTSRARPGDAATTDPTERQGTETVTETEEEGPIRVLLVDDHAVVRLSLIHI